MTRLCFTIETNICQIQKVVKESKMKKIYMVLLWVCALKWPICTIILHFNGLANIFSFIGAAKVIFVPFDILIFFYFFLIEGYFTPLTILMTLILLNRVQKKRVISKLEIILAIASWGFTS